MTDENGSGSASMGPANPAAFWLSVAGLAIQVVAIVMLATLYSAFPAYGYGMFGMMNYYGTMMGPYYGDGWHGLAGIWIIISVISIVLGTVGVMWMKSAKIGKLRSGAVLVLVAAIVAFPTMWGFWIGSILMLVGAIMGLATPQERHLEGAS